MKLAKILSALLIVLIVVTCSVTVVSAAPNNTKWPTQQSQTGIYEGFLNYKISRRGEVSITKCSAMTSGVVKIPSVIEEKPVTSIEDYAFQYCLNITGVEIPLGVTEIGYSAFYGCVALESINIPESVNKIEYGAFYNCKALKKAEIGSLNAWCNTSLDGEYANPAHITGELIIDGAPLVDLIIPNDTVVVSDYTFYGCKGLKTVGIPDSLTTIGECAFYGCESLTSINITSNITNIGGGAFSACNNLKNIEVDVANKKYNSVSGNLIDVEAATLILGNDNGDIPNDGSVTRLGDYAFSGNNSLTSITVPDAITVIGSSVFRDCKELKTAKLPDNLTVIRAGVFAGCEKLDGFVIPQKTETIGVSAFRDCKALSEIKLPSSVSEIGNFAFAGCESLTEIDIHKNVKTLGEGVFDRCSKLVKFSVEEGNGKYYVFNNCLIEFDGNEVIRGSKYSVIHDGVNVIGKYAFSGVTDMEVMGIPASIGKIEENAFDGCTGLKKVYYGGDEAAFKKIKVSVNNDAVKSAEVVYNNAKAPVPKMPSESSGGLFQDVGSDGSPSNNFVWIIVAIAAAVIILGGVVAVIVTKKKKAK